jgi:hypothetical protein
MIISTIVKPDCLFNVVSAASGLGAYCGRILDAKPYAKLTTTTGTGQNETQFAPEPNDQARKSPAASWRRPGLIQ